MPTVVKPTRRKKPQPAPPRPKRAAPRRAPATAPAPVVVEQPNTWSELAGAPGGRKRERPPGMVDAVPTLRFALLLALACAALTLYVGHLYASQTLVDEVQELRRENLRLVMQQNRLRGEFDRMTAPSVILNRAEAIGLHGSGDYAPVIIITD
jgi:hypothetical protein